MQGAHKLTMPEHSCKMSELSCMNSQRPLLFYSTACSCICPKSNSACSRHAKCLRWQHCYTICTTIHCFKVLQHARHLHRYGPGWHLWDQCQAELQEGVSDGAYCWLFDLFCTCDPWWCGILPTSDRLQCMSDFRFWPVTKQRVTSAPGGSRFKPGTCMLCIQYGWLAHEANIAEALLHRHTESRKQVLVL